MRAFCAAVSRVNGGSGGRDMVTSAVDAAANLSPPPRKSRAVRLSPDN
jgi:hypothetical protein